MYNNNIKQLKRSEQMYTPKFPELVVNQSNELDFEKIYKETYEEDAVV